MRIFEESPFFKLKQQLNGETIRDVGRLSAFGSAVLLCCFFCNELCVDVSSYVEQLLMLVQILFPFSFFVFSFFFFFLRFGSRR